MRSRISLLAGLAASVLVLGACSDQTPVSDDASPTRGADRGDKTPRGDQDPTAPTSPTPSDGDDTGSGEQRAVAVYYVGDTERAGPRLYREFQRLGGAGLDASLAGLTGSPRDPDYRTLWQPTQLTSASYDGDVINVTVDPSVRERPSGMSRRAARVAVEQVIYTLQAAVQQRAAVQFRTADNPIDQVFGVPTAEPLANGDMLAVLSHLSLTSPEQGSIVDDGTLQISGVGNSFEANVGWEIRQGDEVVMDGFATMEGWMEPKLFPFETTADVSDLPAGDYTFWATTDDPTGGTEGVGAMTDDKDFTIE